MPANEGKHYFFRDRDANLEFWAENGMITLVDLDLVDKDVQDTWRIPPGDFMKRALALLVAGPDHYASCRRDLLRLVDNAKEACKLAKAQGDPTDQRTLEHVSKHKANNRIVVPGGIVTTGTAAVPMKIVTEDTASKTLKHGAKVVPALVQ